METMKRSANHLLVSKGWIQAVAIVVVFGFFVLGLLAYRTYRDEPPIGQTATSDLAVLLIALAPVAVQATRLLSVSLRDSPALK